MTLTDLQNEVLPYQNTLVLDHFNVVRLVGVVEDEDDFYWVFDGHRGVYHSSCVCDWEPLKGVLPTERYEQLVRIWNLNNTEPAV